MTGRRTLVLALLLALGLVAAACSHEAALAPLPKPKRVAGADATPTTALEELAGVDLPRARGTTTTSVALGPGAMRIDGTVQGPDGPVPNAVVHLERLVGDAVVATDVPTGADGKWNIEHVLGGRWRIRAFQAPALAQVGAIVLFLSGPNPPVVVLQVERFQGLSADRALAPDPPVVGDAFNLAIRLSTKLVAPDGTVRATAEAGADVQLSGSAADWTAEGPVTGVTDGSGDVSFRLVCRTEGPHPLALVYADGSSQDLGMPACVAPAPSTTTTSPVAGPTSSTSSTLIRSSTTSTTSTTTTTTVPRPTTSSTTTSTIRPR